MWKKKDPNRVVHVYNSVGSGGFYSTICGLRSDEQPQLEVLSIHTAGRLSAKGNIDGVPCEHCFQDERVAMRTLASIEQMERRDPLAYADIEISEEQFLQ